MSDHSLCRCVSFEYEISNNMNQFTLDQILRSMYERERLEQLEQRRLAVEDGHLNEQIKICRTLHVKSKHDNDWLQNLTLCKEYIRKHKMGYIRRTGFNYQIEEWANRQRKQHEKNTLALWKVQMLQCIHFKFNP